jgi:hypothetical protein
LRHGQPQPDQLIQDAAKTREEEKCEIPTHDWNLHFSADLLKLYRSGSVLKDQSHISG